MMPCRTNFFILPYTTLFRSLAPVGGLDDGRDQHVRSSLGSATIGLRFTVGVPEPTRNCRVALMSNEAKEVTRSEENTTELQSPCNIVLRLELEEKKGDDTIT